MPNMNQNKHLPPCSIPCNLPNISPHRELRPPSRSLGTLCFAFLSLPFSVLRGQGVSFTSPAYLPGILAQLPEPEKVGIHFLCTFIPPLLSLLAKP